MDGLQSDPMLKADTSRRPLKSRGSTWARAIAGWLARRRVRPNVISLASVAFACLAAAALLTASQTPEALLRSALLVGAAAAIQLRLACNLLDGMVAIEGELRTKTGGVFNDLPDRIADLLVLVAAGYSVSGAFGSALGWAAGVFAVLTAYVRVLGASLDLPHDFGGPMAKPQRMAILTAGCLAEAASAFRTEWLGWPLTACLVVIVAGGALTVVVRTRRLIRALEER